MRKYIENFSKYNYLLGELVKKDIKLKYRRSKLGILWTLIEPILTTIVLTIVFTKLKGKTGKDYPFSVYILTGRLLYSFFAGATKSAAKAIRGNAGMIKKVYVPKYIYPLSRAMSSLVNLGFSLIPLLIVTFVTGLWPRPAFVLLPFPIICMMIFSLGMSYFLSTSMVFFKDTQCIWNVLSTEWLYATPIFYPENIIDSPILLKAFHCNPMYQFIYFMRSILIDGVSPSPQHYLYCILLSVIPFMLGFWFFKRNEDKFIFNL